MRHSRKIALSGVLSALAVALLLVGSLIGVGTYAAPMLAGVALMPVGMSAGKKYHILSWIGVSLIGLMLLSDREEALMFACLFGWYPIARPYFDGLKKPFDQIARYAALNGAAIGVEALVMLVIAPESNSALLLIGLLLLANVTFVLYDKLIPKVKLIILVRFGKYL